jgi:hypothetical protein
MESRRSRSCWEVVLFPLTNPGTHSLVFEEFRWEQKSFCRWSEVKNHPFGDNIKIEGRAVFDFSSFQGSGSYGLVRFTVQQGYLCSAERFFWDREPDFNNLKKTITLELDESFFILDEEGVPTKKVLILFHSPCKQEDEPWYVHTRIIRTRLTGRGDVIEPEVVIPYSYHQRDWEHWSTRYYMDVTSNPLDLFLDVFDNDPWPYVGTISKEAAVRTLKEYLQSYEQYLE